MKRSEMINILAKEFINRGMCGEKLSTLASNEILDVIEKAGMMPPIEPGRTEYDLDLGIPEWEKEDA